VPAQVGTRKERAYKALNPLGLAIFNGGFTIFLAVLPLALATSFVFRTFFKMMTMIVLLGLWHGLCALPVLLSFVGSHPYDSAYERKRSGPWHWQRPRWGMPLMTLKSRHSWPPLQLP